MLPILNAYKRLDIKISHGNGCYLYDQNGKEYLDFAAGIAVNSLGHNHPYLNAILIEQASKLWHCSNLFQIPEQIRLAKRLTKSSDLAAAFFCSSGLEAVETAIKLIRKYHFSHGHQDKFQIISFKNGFHGRSITALSAGGNEFARQGYGPFLAGFVQAELNNIDSVKKLISDKTAGIIIEPIQSEGGIFPAEQQFLKELRELANKHAALLCFDEVQTGIGRIGSLFHFKQLGVQPDIVTIAKAMGNGFPLAACLCNEKTAKIITPGSHGSTYGGNPLAMAVGNGVLDLLDDYLLSNVRKVSKYLKEQLLLLAQEFPEIITEVRGEGLLLGVEIKKSAWEIVLQSVENGLVITRSGGDKVLRISPPLIITELEVDKAIAILRKVLR